MKSAVMYFFHKLGMKQRDAVIEMESLTAVGILEFRGPGVIGTKGSIKATELG